MSRETPRVAVIGVGNRGARYADSVVDQGGEIVAVADPDQSRRQAFGSRHQIPSDDSVDSWEQLDLAGREIDGVIIATMDDLHVDPALRFASLEVPMLLEKPIGETWSECQRLSDGLPENAAAILTGHVLRYTPYTQRLKQLIADDVLGEIVNIHHFEPVGFWHFAHSFTRGRWRSTKNAAPLIVSKACHDVDWVMHLVPEEVVAVSSFGSLRHFKPENQPAGAAARCTDCNVNCAYDAKKIYLEPAQRGEFAFPVRTITDDHTVAAVASALADGSYGQCVYQCDNDVVDNQVSTLLFEGGATATVTVSAFTAYRGRHTVIGGTKGEATVTSDAIDVYTFDDRQQTQYGIDAPADGIDDGHAGGDAGLVSAFLAEIRNPSSDGERAFGEAMRTHRVAFALEEARVRNTVVDPREIFDDTSELQLQRRHL